MKLLNTRFSIKSILISIKTKYLSDNLTIICLIQELFTRNVMLIDMLIKQSVIIWMVLIMISRVMNRNLLVNVINSITHVEHILQVNLSMLVCLNIINLTILMQKLNMLMGKCMKEALVMENISVIKQSYDIRMVVNILVDLSMADEKGRHSLLMLMEQYIAEPLFMISSWVRLWSLTVSVVDGQCSMMAKRLTQKCVFNNYYFIFL